MSDWKNRDEIFGHCLIWMVVAFILFALLWVGAEDAITEAQDHYHYCEMVALWHADSHLEPGMRRGWPPFRGECR